MFSLQVCAHLCAEGIKLQVSDITAAAIMGTMFWPFNFIHVKGDGGKPGLLFETVISV